MPPFRSSNHGRRRSDRLAPSMANAFTLTELLTVIAIIAILAAIIVPVVGKVRTTARTSQCSSNLRQVFNLYMLDVQENRGKIFMTGDGSGYSIWLDGVATDYYGAEGKGIGQALGCPTQIDLKPNILVVSARNQRAPRTYSLNRDLNRSLASPYTDSPRAYASFASPPRTALAGDGNDSDGSPDYYTGIIGTGRPPQRPHSDKANIVFLDGHIEAVSDQTLLTVTSTPKAGTPQAMFWFGE
jgi:prepilin-type N-terminal cleavage/methylation domain-containing protein/prepilin-type processing-associated H-X9-DG protein